MFVDVFLLDGRGGGGDGRHLFAHLVHKTIVLSYEEQVCRHEMELGSANFASAGFFMACLFFHPRPPSFLPVSALYFHFSGF